LRDKKILNGNSEVLNELESIHFDKQFVKKCFDDRLFVKEEIRSLYKKAFIYVFPSVEEGFGIPILEAFALKTPVVTSNAEQW